MKNVIHFLSLVILLLIFGFTADPTWTTSSSKDYHDAMEKSRQYFETHSRFAVQVTHASWKGYDAAAPYEESKGYFRRDGNKYHSYLLGIHTLQDGKYKLVVDSLNKRMLVASPDDASTAMTQNSSAHIDTYVSSWRAATTDNGKKFRLDMNDRPAYSAFEIELGSDGQLQSMTTYYRKEYPSNSSDTSSVKKKPKLTITWSNYDTHTAWSSKEFDTGKYITEVNGKISATTAYSAYRVSDTRLNK